ncbi:MAG TPA: DMT family transporter [Candidatus Acidoferrum sp.]|nr:DMT family transporter [Candidatus Acidoferrum sp.]
MGILLGLLTAAFWGSSDFVARFAAHRIGALRTSFYMQLAGFFLLSIFLPWAGGWGHLFDGSGWHPWAWGLLAGLLNGIATLSLYRSFEVGKMTIVAPLSASYPALTVALSLLTGEHLSEPRLAGIAVIVAGVAFVAGGEQTAAGRNNSDSSKYHPIASPPLPGRTRSGIAWALLSATGFGFLFWLLGTRIVPAVGYAATVWMIRLTSSILTAIIILCLRQPISLRRAGPIPFWLVGMGALDTFAFVMSNYGMQIEQVAVVSVLASLYGAVTVALAAIFLREHVSRWQCVGIVSIFTGIFLISR